MPSKTVDSGPAASSSDPARHDGRRQPSAKPEAGHTGNRTIDLGSIEEISILGPDGTADEARVPDLPDDELRRIHRAMVLTRKLDVRMLNMQRQGQMGTFAPGLGQEATQIGQVYPLQQQDWYSPSYRTFGAQLWRGWSIDGLMLLWDGFFEGFEVPEGVNDLPFSIVIGSHVPLAVGVAMGIRSWGEDGVVLMNFGDGASSQGIVAESMNFAAVYKSPVVFLVENNGWAISVPAERQSGVTELARRGPGFGIPSVRADGNDIYAMLTACTHAVEHARSGKGPFLVEAVTYRMSVHTTADDPKVYRSEEDVKAWESRCPIARFERHLVQRGVLDEARIEQVATECEQEVLDGRERFRGRAKANPREVFDYMFARLPPELEAQKQEYLRKLDRKGVE